MYARIITSQMKVSHLTTAASIWQKSATEDLKPMNGFKSACVNADFHLTGDDSCVHIELLLCCWRLEVVC